MRCPRCYNELQHDADRCEYCGAYIGKKSPHRRARDIALGVLLVIAILAIVISTSDSRSRNSVGRSNSASSSSTTSASSAATTPSQTTPSQTATEEPTEKPELIIYEKNGIKVTFLYYDGSRAIPEFVFHVENDSEYDVYIDSDNESINDYMITTSLLTKVAAGKKATAKMSFFKSNLYDSGIKTINKLEFELKISEAGYYGKSPIDDSELIRIDI